MSFLNFLDRNVLTGSINVMAKELHFSLDGVGYISSAFLIVYTLGTFPLGLWADRSSRKKVVAFSVAVWSLVTAATALASNFLTLFISRMALGIGEAGYFPAGTALLSDCYAREKRSQVMSRWGAAQYIGILGGFGLGGVIAGLFTGSWRYGFLLTGIPGLLLAFLIWRIREPRRNQADEEAGALQASAMTTDPAPVEVASLYGREDNSSWWTRCKQLVHVKTVMVITVMQIFSYFVFSVCLTFLPTYLQQKDVFHMSSGFAGIYSGGVLVLAGLVGTIGSGYASDYLERFNSGARVLIGGLVLFISAPSLAATVLTRNFTVFTILLFVTAMLLAAFSGPSTAALQDAVPSWLRSSALAFSLLIGHLLGDAVSPAIVGVLATNFDPTHGEHFRQALAGGDLTLAIAYTCVPAIAIAGLVGIVGARWLKSDVVAAEKAEQTARAEAAVSAM
jgi:MFS family permease